MTDFNAEAGVLSRYSALCRKIENVSRILGQMEPPHSLGDEIEKLNEVSEALKRKEKLDDFNEADATHSTRGWSPRISYYSEEYTKTESEDDSPRESSERYFISHHPSPVIEERTPRRRNVPLSQPRLVGREETFVREISPPLLPPGREPIVIASSELICQVDRAPMDLDMSHHRWRDYHNNHVIVAYHKDLPAQGLVGDRKTTKRPLRIRINSEALIEELNMADVIQGKVPLMSVTKLCPKDYSVNQPLD
jgi:hypothetical protein